MQFAVCHEICHGVAGRLFQLTPVKYLSYHIFTLPAVGGETHMYYAYQHIGHHAALGSMEIPTSLDDFDGDLPSPSAVLLLAAGVLDGHLRQAGGATAEGSEGSAPLPAAKSLGSFSCLAPGLKVVLAALYQAGHYLMLALFSLL